MLLWGHEGYVAVPLRDPNHVFSSVKQPSSQQMLNGRKNAVGKIFT